MLINGDSLGYVRNPLNAFLIIKRLSIDLEEFNEKLEKIAKDFKENSVKLKISKDEFEGASDGLVRLQRFYKLKTEDLAKGIIQGQKYRDDLAPDELLALGVAFMNEQHFITSLSYLDMAFKKSLMHNMGIPSIRILEQIFQRGLQVVDMMIELEPDRKDLEVEEKELEDVDVTESFWLELPHEQQNVSKVCSGEITQTDAELSKLYCRYVSRTSFSNLARFKVEEVNLNPYIAIFHEVISDDEIKIFKSKAKPFLYRAKVFNEDATSRVDDIRVAKVSWHEDAYHKVFGPLKSTSG